MTLGPNFILKEWLPWLQDVDSIHKTERIPGGTRCAQGAGSPPGSQSLPTGPSPARAPLCTSLAGSILV